MPIMLSPQDVDDVFDDEGFLEERFADVQRLLLGCSPAPCADTPVDVPSSRLRVTVRPDAPGPLGRCSTLRIDTSSPVAPAAGRVELVLADDGSLLGLADAGALDGWRAAVPSGLAARYLAPPGPQALGLFGAGEQAWACLLVLRRALPSLAVVRVVGRDRARTRKFALAAGRYTGLTVLASDDPSAGARHADVVVATGGHPPVRADWLTAGALLIDQTDTTRPPRLARTAVRGVRLAPAGRPPATGPSGCLALGEIVAGRALPRRSGADIVHYRSADLAGWNGLAAVAGLCQAWRRDLGTPLPVGRSGR
ncbi:hypothetical protein GCM10010497_18760 [Streptomyces cinereoruber]|uniref:Ornithine cyclodeaminase family protein n=2 Tax=Streptomyces cinereoruber TaxID=67260 RepID=A0AAV4KFA8_9ACTN|nr:hypothetical protein [Streptomyces cinereoruber]MBY8816406.1 hypothetical protein [Streptomyces cinereoruber]NIH62174.1 hypothetical protein [Streptomyces cinereoruber]QEV35560.1 hypothetical protein CP977_28065 [Streptomyces cinereoruber]GGR16681.1 hypothetical protein GCM10010497_18760 [Streptomyces cinereoruber]